MSNDIVMLVGDRFEAFAHNPRVARISDFLAWLPVADAHGRSIVVGQGLSRSVIERVAAESGKGVALSGPSAPADRALTHKHRSKNILISVPGRREDGTYEAELSLDDDNEVMEDHQTGQHIQGLVLIEAARQMWTAVTERFFLAGSRPTRFIIDEVQARFEGFVFPLPSTLTLEVLDAVTTPMQRSFSVRVVIRQVGRDTTTINARYRVIDERVSARQEAVAAQRALEVALADSNAEMATEGR